jgi:hypothetical protein
MRPRKRLTRDGRSIARRAPGVDTAQTLGQTVTTALRGARRSAPASGVASIRLDRAGRQPCWRIWTDDFLPQHASITLEGTVEAEKPLIFHTGIWRDGQSQGCARLGRANAQPDRRLQVDSPSYLLILTGPRVPPLTGTVVLPPGELRPATANAFAPRHRATVPQMLLSSQMNKGGPHTVDADSASRNAS